MMFGAGAAAAAKPTNQTMMFGAPDAPPAANRTAMFGATPGPAGAGKAAAKSSTMMFGAAPPAPVPASAAPAANQTMMFGAIGGPAAVAPANPVTTRPTSQTMVFGTAAVAPAAAPAAASQNRTMMFGIPAADKPSVEPAAPPARSTMIFGAAEAEGNPGKLTERTVRIGPEDLERMMREHNASKGERSVELTPPGGAPAAGASQKTQMFAMSDIRPPGEASTPAEGREAITGPSDPQAAVQARHDRTAMFAMSPESPQLPPLIGTAEVAPVERSNVRFDPSLMETLPPGNADEPLLARSTMIFGAGQGGPPARPHLLDLTTNPDLIATTMPNLPPLPREKADLSPQLDMNSADEPAPFPEEPGVDLEQQVKRRNRLAMLIVVAAIVAAAAAVGWKLFGARLFGTSVPLVAMQGVESGLAELRKDDTASKAAAVASLSAVVQSHPGFVDAHAGLVTALTLQLDDLQQRAKRLDKAADERNTRISRYNKEKSPNDWENRAAALAAEVGALKKDYDPLVESARELEGRLREAYRAMQVAASQGDELNRQGELALIRAQALYHAYAGSEEALKATKRYQAKADGKSDGWIDLVDAEYAANTRASPDLVEAAQKQLTALQERDPTFFRTYVLAARLHLQTKAYDDAEAELATVSALKPQHDIANELAEWVKKLKAEKPAKKELP